MSAHKAGLQTLKALGKHAELIINAYESANSFLLENTDTAKAVHELVHHKLAVRGTDNNVRLESNLKLLLDRSLKTSRLKMVNADIGSAVEGIIFLARQYNSVKRQESSRDKLQYLNDLQNNVAELQDSLSNQTQVIWRQIDSDFGAVSSLGGKMELNKNAIIQVNRTLDSLGLIDLQSMYSICHNDTELQRLLLSGLPETIEQCRRDLSDAIIRLNNMLFKLKRLANRARIVNQLRDRWNQEPSYQPLNYADQLDIPDVFNLAPEIPMRGMAQIQNPSFELDFTDMLIGLRKKAPPLELKELKRVSTNTEKYAIEEIVLSKLKLAIRGVFFDCLVQNQAINGLESYSLAPQGIDINIWLYALMAEYNAMDTVSRRNFDLKFEGDYDTIFTGNFKATDLVLCPS